MTPEELLHAIFGDTEVKEFCSACGEEIYEDECGNLEHSSEHPGCAQASRDEGA